VSKKRLCFGNWKLNKNPKEAKDFIQSFLSKVSDEDLRDFCIFPTDLLAHQFSGFEIPWGGQNSYSENSGAYTGESSPETLKFLGADYCLVGHSERRSFFNEDNELLNKKTKNIIEQGLKPVFCIGESLTEREEGHTKAILQSQLQEGLKGVPFEKVIIAYEPVWAIGTGKAATSEIVAEVHGWIKDLCGEAKTPLLYGGRVKPENAGELYEIEEVDGFLIGGASLKVESFLEIHNKMKEQ
jgi:triosephosphate isomerase